MRSKKRSRARQKAQDSVKRRRRNVKVDHVDEQDEDSDDEDEIRDFRRVQIVQGNPQQEIRPTPVPTLNDVSGQSNAHRPNEQEAHNTSRGVSQHPGTSINDTEISEISLDQTQQQRNIFDDPDVPIERSNNYAVPKLDRTMNDIFSDELYNANFVDNTSSSSKASQALVSPPRPSTLFAERLQTANYHHSTSRPKSSPPAPFKTGSPLTSGHESLFQGFIQSSDVGSSSDDSMVDNSPFMDAS